MNTATKRSPQTSSNPGRHGDRGMFDDLARAFRRGIHRDTSDELAFAQRWFFDAGMSIPATDPSPRAACKFALLGFTTFPSAKRHARAHRSPGAASGVYSRQTMFHDAAEVSPAHAHAVRIRSTSNSLPGMARHIVGLRVGGRFDPRDRTPSQTRMRSHARRLR